MCGKHLLSKTTEIKSIIEKYLEMGFTDKHKIYTEISEKYNVPRPTVRRCARALRLEMQEKVKVLSNQLMPDKKQFDNGEYF